MNYRKLGNTGLTVSEIGMGCEGFVDKNYEQVKEFLDIMEEGGVNCIDLYSPDPQARSHLGRALSEGHRYRVCDEISQSGDRSGRSSRDRERALCGPLPSCGRMYRLRRLREAMPV